MSELGNELMASAGSRIGLPFHNHFRPVNECAGGQTTLDQCMKRGMDDAGFDCSGLVIASLAEILKIDPKRWPRQYRHARQLTQLAEERAPEPGDIHVYVPLSGQPHVSVATGEFTVIHASGATRTVEEDDIAGIYELHISIRSIAVERLYRVLKANDVIPHPYAGGCALAIPLPVPDIPSA